MARQRKETERVGVALPPWLVRDIAAVRGIQPQFVENDLAEHIVRDRRGAWVPAAVAEDYLGGAERDEGERAAQERGHEAAHRRREIQVSERYEELAQPAIEHIKGFPQSWDWSYYGPDGAVGGRRLGLTRAAQAEIARIQQVAREQAEREIA